MLVMNDIECSCGLTRWFGLTPFSQVSYGRAGVLPVVWASPFSHVSISRLMASKQSDEAEVFPSDISLTAKHENMEYLVPYSIVLAGIWPGSQVSRSRFHCSGSRSWV